MKGPFVVELSLPNDAVEIVVAQSVSAAIAIVIRCLESNVYTSIKIYQEQDYK